jgi:predicted ATP-dependent protease
VVFGEVGLTGEVRAVAQIETRLREAAKLGFQRCLLPQANCQPAPTSVDIELYGVRTVAEALQVMQYPDGSATSIMADKSATTVMAAPSRRVTYRREYYGAANAEKH